MASSYMLKYFQSLLKKRYKLYYNKYSTRGKIFIGIEDKTNEVIGIGEKNPFKLVDNISNMIVDSCTPIIDPEITAYYIKSPGKEQSTYIRINGTSLAMRES